MAQGDVYLGAPGALRPYKLVDPKRLVRSSANQMASKIAQGSAEYDDQTSWSAWVLSNFQAGVGQKDPTGGGFLFSTAETRFENQLFLPLAAQQLVEQATNNFESSSKSEFDMRINDTVGTFFTVGAGDWTKIGELLQSSATRNTTHVDVFLPGTGSSASVVSVTVEIRNTAAGLPTTLVESHTVTLTGEIGHSWYQVDLTMDLTTATVYAVTIFPNTGTIQVIGTALGVKQNAGGTWSTGAGLLARYHKHDDTPNAAIGKIIEFPNGTSYDLLTATTTSEEIHGLGGSGAGLIELKDYIPDITDLLATGEKVFIGLGDVTNYDTMSPTAVFTAGAVPGRLFTLHNGLLYRAVGDSIYYTDDEVTWVGPIVVADPGYTIIGMHGFQDDLIVSTENTLWRVTWGDQVRLLTNWGTIDSANGKYMHNFQGKLYISVGASLLQYDGDGILPFGVDLKEGLPAAYHGDVVGIASNNNWLLTAIRGATYSSVWAHNGQGWHCIAVLPKSSHASALAYIGNGLPLDSLAAHYENRVIVGTEAANPVFRIALPDTARSNFKLAQTTNELYYFNLSAVIETDWFYGSQREVRKDFESVYIDGENLGANGYIEVYWQDEGSTGWETLGTIDADGEELRWTLAAGQRPNSRKLKLKLHLFSKTYASSPVINAIRVKFMPMLFDRWRWQVPIEVAEDQQEIDGTRQITYSIADQVTHLDGLTTQIPPFVFQDINGVQYEVKLLDSTRNVNQLEYYSATRQIEYIYALTLEQVVTGVYGA